MCIEKLKQLAIQILGEDSHEFELLLKHIQVMDNLLDKGVIHNEYELDEVEVLTLVLLEGFGFDMIQKPAFNHNLLNEFNKILIEYLDSALKKIPITSHKVLYRQDDYQNKVPKIGEVISFTGFLTTSKDDFDNTYNVKWIITPLSNKTTKAHDIYIIYNHGYDVPYPEYQVEFERGTKFKVTKVIDKGIYSEVSITEL
jgi:hypothetical protein